MQFIHSKKNEVDTSNELLYKICSSVVHSNGVEIDPNSIDKESNSLKDEYLLITSIIRGITKDDWSFLNDLENN